MMNKKLILVLASSLLIIIGITAAYVLMNMTTTTAVYVDPDKVTGSIDQDLTINISISNVANLYAWECKFGWNTTVLDLMNVIEGPFLKQTGSTFLNYGLNETFGHVVIDCTLLGNAVGANGNGALASIQFHIKDAGTCDLTLYDTKLVDTFEGLIGHTVDNGHFSTSP